MNIFYIINKLNIPIGIKNMFICNDERKEISRLLKLNKKMNKKLNFLIDRAIKDYNKRDSAEDIEHTIFEGILSYLNFQKIGNENYDFFTKRILTKKRNYQLTDKSPLIKVIINEYNRIGIASEPNRLKFLVENIISIKYGNRSRKRWDLLKIYVDFKEEYLEDSVNNLGI